MAHGWDDGDEPWLKGNHKKLEQQGFKPTAEFYELPQASRADIFVSARDFGTESRYMEIDEEAREKWQHPSRGSECFIATAVYGNPEAPQVQALRDFRDNILMEHPLGRKFVDFYYSGAGKRTADFVSEHVPSAIPMIRRGLDALVDRYSPQRK